MKQPKYLIHFL